MKKILLGFLILLGIVFTQYAQAELAVVPTPPQITLTLSNQTASAITLSVSGRLGTRPYGPQCYNDPNFNVVATQEVEVATQTDPVNEVTITDGPSVFLNDSIPVVVSSATQGTCFVSHVGATFSGSRTFSTSGLSPGTYNITARVVDSLGGADSDTKSFTIAAPITFNVTASANPPGGGSPNPTPQTINSSSSANFSINANSGYSVDTANLQGSCPFGFFSNNNASYTTGSIFASCNVVFYFSTTLNGFHDAYSGTVGSSECNAQGWAALSNGAGGLAVRVLSDGSQVWSGTANSFRGDLTGVCSGGNCAYNVDLNNLISHGANHSITVEAFNPNNNAWSGLTGTPKTLNCIAPTGTISSSNCQIATGASSCPSSINWTTSTPLNGVTSAVTTPTNITVATGNSGSTTYLVAHGSRFFFLYHNGVELAQSMATADCGSGDDFVNGVCRARPTITATQAANCSINPPGASTIIYGSDLGYSITPDAGHTVSSLIINGSSIAGATSYTFSNVTSNKSISASCASTACTNNGINPPTCSCQTGSVLIGGQCTPVAVSVSATTPYNTTPGANVAFSYSPSTNEPGGSTQCHLLNNSQADLTAYPGANPINYAAPNGIGSYGYYVQCRNTNFTSATATSNQIIVNTSCTSGTTWNGTSCAVIPGMSGTLTPGPNTSCTIASGGNSCTKSLTWTTTNPVGTSAVTSPTGTPSPGSSVNNGTQTFTVPYNASGVNFFLYNNAVQLDQTNVATICTSGSNWNGTSCVAAIPTGTITATSGTVSGGGTFNSTITWSTQNPLSGVTSGVTTPSNITVATANSGTTSYPVTLNNGSRTFYLYHNGVLLAQATAVACAGGTSWNGSTCVAPPPVGTMSGTLAPDSTTCTIALNASSCNINFSWIVNNPVVVNGSTVTKSPNVTVGTGDSGGNVPLSVKYNSETFYLSNNGQQLDFKNVFSSCAPNTTWDGIKCASTPPSCATGTTWNGSICACNNGANNPSICTTTGNPAVCVNGATNPPTCTTGSGGKCLNGAINPPTCNHQKPIFKEI